MAESLFTSQTPVSANNSDGTPSIIAAVTLKFAVAGSISHVRFYATTTTGGTYTGKVYQLTSNTAGSEIGSGATSSGITGGTWNTVALDTPASVDTSHGYRIGLHNSQGRYVSSSNVFTSGGGGITNGNITALANLDTSLGFEINNGTFHIGSSSTDIGFPSDTFNATNYFVDVLFTPAGAGSIAPAGVAVTVALGSPTLAQSFTVLPSGIAVPAAAGSPTLAQHLTVAPTGLATAAALGSPTLAQSPAVAPGGIAVPVALGAPTLAQAVAPGFAIAPAGTAVPVTIGSMSLSQAVPRTGGWESLSAMAREAALDHQRELERRRNPIDCPIHGWPLEVTSRGKHCKFGGHVVR